MVIWKVINACQSGWVKAAAALCVLAICIGSLLPETDRVPTGLPDGKLEHFLAYSVTGLLLGLAMSGRKAPILAALNLALLACLLEFLQQWSAGRHPRVSDAVVGALAGMLGAGLSAWLRKGAASPAKCASRKTPDRQATFEMRSCAKQGQATASGTSYGQGLRSNASNGVGSNCNPRRHSS